MVRPIIDTVKGQYMKIIGYKQVHTATPVIRASLTLKLVAFAALVLCLVFCFDATTIFPAG